MRKITKATLKSFIKNNKDKLYIKVSGSFDGMQDCIDFRKSEFEPAKQTDKFLSESFGIEGVLVIEYGSKNYFKPYKDDNFTGIEVSNCCRYFTVAIPN